MTDCCAWLGFEIFHQFLIARATDSCMTIVGCSRKALTSIEVTREQIASDGRRDYLCSESCMEMLPSVRALR